jgi:malate synthase
MEDAATAEIARTQIWQWLRYPKGVLDDGLRITAELFRTLLKDDLEGLRQQLGTRYNEFKYENAARLLTQIALSEHLPPFLTLEAYDSLP